MSEVEFVLGWAFTLFSASLQTPYTTADPETLFEPKHWLLEHLLSRAQEHNTNKTMEQLRVHGLFTYPGHVMAPPRRTEEVKEPNEAPPASSTAESAEAVLASTGTRPRRNAARNAMKPARYVQDGDDAPQPPRHQRSTRRSLQQQFDAAVDNHPTTAPGRGRSGVVREPTVDTIPHSSQSPPHSPLPAAAAPRQPQSSRVGTVGTRLLNNTQAWIRANTPGGRMTTRVHSTAAPSWTNQCRSALQQLATALQQSPMDEAKVIGLVCVLWLLPAAVFATPGRTRGGRRGRRSRHHRIHHALEDRQLLAKLFTQVWGDQLQRGNTDDESEGILQRIADARDDDASVASSRDDAAMLGDASECAEQSSPSSLQSDNDSHSDSDCEHSGAREAKRAAQQVECHMAAGHLTRAMRCLSSTSSKADTRLAGERERLKVLHPSCPSQLPQCPADAQEADVDLDWMANEMAASDTGAAPGLSGWGSNMLSVLATNTHCVTALALILKHIINNTMPPAVRTLLTTARLVSLVKDDRGGRRPVAVGEMLYRLASRYALFRVIGHAQRLLAPHQFGVSEQDDCSQVVQSLQHLLTQSPQPVPSPPNRVRSGVSIPSPLRVP